MNDFPWRTKYQSLEEAKKWIRDGDLLLFRRRGLISIAGRGIHSHAGKAAWWDDDLFCLEVREWHGGRAVTLESQVARFPHRIDVYGANAGSRWTRYQREKATRYMRRLAGCDYGYLGVLTAAMLHLPGIRLWARPEGEERQAEANGGKRPPFCSQACAAADRYAGVDPVPNLVDRLTEPADLARSPFYEYQCTII
jgi:hypothetical protein